MNTIAKQIRDYDNLNNEGGEGYNPYRDALENESIELPETNESRLSDVIHQLSILDTSMARESGTYDADKIAALETERDRLRAEIDAEFLSIWTPELTTTRRNEWNAWVKSQGKNISNKELSTKIKTMGWSLNDLKRAIKLNHL